MIKDSRRIRALIIDDERAARDTIRLLLSSDPEIEIIGECGDGATAIESIHAKIPDLVFLDVQMPERNGFEVLQEIGGTIPAVIFVTAYDEYAIQAFEVEALDYLLKPFTDERFYQSVQRVKTRIRGNDLGQLQAQLSCVLAAYRESKGGSGNVQNPTYADRLPVKSDRRIQFVKVADIDWIEAADQYVQIHSRKTTHLLRESLSQLETKLDPARFKRIHRSTIVNIDSVKELQPYQKGDYIVILYDGTRLKLSRSHRRQLQDILS